MIVFKNPQRQWLAAAEQEMAQRIQERDTAQARINQLQETIDALRRLIANEEETEDVSLPKLCLRVLSFSGNNYQTVPMVRDGLRTIGVQVPGPNPLGVLHTALARLVDNQFAESRSPKPGAPLQYRIKTAGRLVLQNR